MEKVAGFKDYAKFFGNLPKLLKIVWDSSPKLVVTSVTLPFLTSLNPVIQSFIYKLVIDRVFQAIEKGEAFDSAMLDIVKLLLLSFGIGIVRSLLGRLRSTSETLLRDKLTIHLNTLLFEKSASLSLAYFEDPTFRNRYEKIRQYALGRVINSVWYLSDIFSEIVRMGSFLFVALRFNLYISLGFLVLALPGAFFDLFFAKRFYGLANSQTPKSRLAWYLSHLLLSDQTVKEIKIFRLAPKLISRFREIALEYYEETKKLVFKREAIDSLLSIIADLSSLLVYFFLVAKALLRQISFGEMNFYREAFENIDRGFSTLLRNITRMYEDNLYLSDLIYFLALTTESFEHSGKRKPDLEKIRVEIKDLWFKYPEAKNWALKDINLIVEPGRSLSLVGENGAGKTTLIKLICGFYEPTKGQILINGVNLNDLDKSRYRKHIGVIFQDFTSFNLTVKENIGFGNVEEMGNPAKVERAAKMSRVDAFIQKLPKRYETMLGRLFEGGHQLSHGEWQKIALARAFMSEGSLLILDEPTASVDAKAEYEIFKRFEKLTEEKSVILISHRFSTARIAEEIAVLEKGLIIEEGTHQELIKKGGKYHKLFSLQAEGYK